MTGIDWSAQLKKIERQFEGLPPEPSESELRAKRENERRVQQKQRRRDEAFSAGTRVVLVLSLSLAINAWPYSRACGPWLYGYLAASAAIVLGGLWAAVAAWHNRAPRLHAVALLAVAWGAILIGAQVLPRVGYAKVSPRNVPTWRCWKANQASVGVPLAKRWLKRVGK